MKFNLADEVNLNSKFNFKFKFTLEIMLNLEMKLNLGVLYETLKLDMKFKSDFDIKFKLEMLEINVEVRDALGVEDYVEVGREVEAGGVEREGAIEN